MIHQKPFVWDNHGCMPLRPGDDSWLPQLERYRRGGVNVVSLNIGFGSHSIEEHVRALAAFRRFILRNPERYRLVTSVDDIAHAVDQDQLGVVFDIEGMGPLAGGDNGLVQMFYDLGVRWMLVAFNHHSPAGSGCHDEEDRGLTPYGRQVIEEMSRVGMAICCSHTGYRTTLDVFEAAQSPVILSHSNAKALWVHPRNVSDEIIRACAATGGVIGVNGLGIFLGDNDNSTAALVRHIDHMVQLVGPDHVGLGLDYVFDQEEMATFMEAKRQLYGNDPSYRAPIRFVEPERIPEIRRQLEQLGYRPDALSKVLGGNWLRIARTVWK